MNRQLTFEDERIALKERIASIKTDRTPIAILADGLTDVRNVGALFRLADAARVEKLFFLDCTVDFNHKKLKNVARSTLQYVDYELIDDISQVPSEYTKVALEVTENSESYTAIAIDTPLLLVIGHENYGVREQQLAAADKTVHIPMLGVNTSMNVITATAIVVYHFLSKIKS